MAREWRVANLGTFPRLTFRQQFFSKSIFLCAVDPPLASATLTFLVSPKPRLHSPMGLAAASSTAWPITFSFHVNTAAKPGPDILAH